MFGTVSVITPPLKLTCVPFPCEFWAKSTPLATYELPLVVLVTSIIIVPDIAL